MVFKFLMPPYFLGDRHILLTLTHVCRSWGDILINEPQTWTAIFATKRDHQSLIKMCLERSHPAPLEVQVEVKDIIYPSCTCDKDSRSRLVTNKIKPCELHFAFGSLAKPEYSGCVHMSDALYPDGTSNVQYFNGVCTGSKRTILLTLKGCQFFEVPYFKPTSLNWKALTQENPVFLLPISLFPPTLRSLSFQGCFGHDQLTNLSNLTSLALTQKINTESFRMIILNNQSLQKLSLNGIQFEGSSSWHPVTLGNLRSFSLHDPFSGSVKILSTLICVPAFKCLSSLFFTFGERCRGAYQLVLHAMGHDIAFSVVCDSPCFMEIWQELIGYPGPTIQSVSFEHQGHFSQDRSWIGVDGMYKLFMDVHTLEIGYGCSCRCFAYIYPNFWDDLGKLGPKLTTICFDIPKYDLGLAPHCICDPWSVRLYDAIKNLMKYRFEHGQPFSSVKRMANGSEKLNARQELVWRGICNTLDQYVQHK